MPTLGALEHWGDWRLGRFFGLLLRLHSQVQRVPNGKTKGNDERRKKECGLMPLGTPA